MSTNISTPSNFQTAFKRLSNIKLTPRDRASLGALKNSIPAKVKEYERAVVTGKIGASTSFEADLNRLSDNLKALYKRVTKRDLVLPSEIGGSF
jgi:hypothetical protein